MQLFFIYVYYIITLFENREGPQEAGLPGGYDRRRGIPHLWKSREASPARLVLQVFNAIGHEHPTVFIHDDSLGSELL